jgi:hypothetical protein
MLRVWTPACSIFKPPRRWARISWSHPISRGLVFASILNEKAGPTYDSAFYQKGTITGDSWNPVGVNFTNSGGNRISFGSPARLNFMSAFTVAFRTMWRSLGGSSQGRIVGKSEKPNGWGINVSSSTQIDFGVKSNGGTNLVTSSPVGSYTYNTWYSIAYSYAGGLIVDDNVRQYKEGVLLANTWSTNMTVARFDDSAEDFRFGASKWDGYTYDGVIEYVYVWNRILSQAEVRFVAASPYGMFAPISLGRHFSPPPFRTRRKLCIR